MLFFNSLNLLLLIGALLLTIPILLFTIECLVATLSKQNDKSIISQDRPKTAILIPAHNEADRIASVIKEVQKQLQNEDRLIVIADNCQDNTAEIASKTGAKVIERTNELKKGKGYALDCGLRYLEETEPPEVVVFLDADCFVAEGAIASITHLAKAKGRPVQAKYLMEQDRDPNLKDRVSAFALKVKNWVRFLGLNRLGGHCLLTGSGMAFPWSAMQKVSLVGAVNADDMKLTVDLALNDLIPTYCDSALVVGRLMKDKDAESQRTRWEHGHLQMISVEVPKLIKAFWKKPRLSLLLLALDISIPPLSLLVMVWLIAIASSLLFVILMGISIVPAFILGINGLMLFTAVFAAWSKFGTKDLPLTNLIAVPFYVIGKIPIYFKFLVKPQTGWLSTERDL
jgi:cellulose synthase/poly-beta-1,6-N-acetylglucosamine synthase-like glycosyltransferase